MKRAFLLSFMWIAIFAFPWWARGENFVATDYLYSTSTMYRPDIPPSNEDLLDNPLIYLPMQLSLYKSIHDRGAIAFWTPNLYAGIPVFSDGLSGHFYWPRLLLFKLFPYDVCFNLSLFGHLLGAGVVAYALARDRGAGKDAALLFSTGWMFNGPCLSWLELDHSAIFILWLPFCLWALPRAGNSWRWVGVAGIGLLGLMTSGHLQWVLYACILIFCDSLWRCYHEDRRYLVRTVLCAVLGVMLASPLLFPTIVHMGTSQRGDNSPDFLQSSFRQFIATAPLTLCYPEAWGSPANGFEFRRIFGYGNFFFQELCVFCGNVVLAMALLALFSSARARRLTFLFGLILLVPTLPIYPWLATVIPGLAKLAPTRITWIACLGYTALAALGFQCWESGQATLRQRRAVALICLTLLAAGVFWVLHLQHQSYLFQSWIHDGQVRLPDAERYLDPTSFRNAAAEGFQRTYRLLGASFLPHFVTLGAVALLLVQSGAWARKAMIVLAGAELLLFAIHVNPSIPGSIYPDNPMGRHLAQVAHGERCMGLYTIKANQMWPFGVRVFEGYDSFYPRATGLVAAHLAGAPPEVPLLPSDPGLAGALANSPWLDLLNVGYLVALSPNPPAPKWVAVPDGAEPPLVLYRNNNPHSRVRVVGQAVVETDWGLVIEKIEKGEVDPSRTILVAEELGALGGEGRADLVEDEAETVGVDAEIRGRAVLVLGDAFAPGWTVTVDGQPHPLLRCDAMFRGVVLEEGRHHVVFHYEPPGFALACGLCILALCGVVGLLAFGRS